MVVWLDGIRAGRESRIIKTIRHPIGGNPISQRRWLDHVRAAAGPAALASFIAPSKRGRCVIALDLWRPSDGARPRILVDRLLVLGKGPGRVTPNIVGGFTISNHSLQRLLQRCGAHDPATLFDKVSAVSRAIMMRTLANEWRDDVSETLMFEGGRIVAMRSTRDDGEIVVLTAMEP
jgi:hypothetical protein